MGEVLAFSQSSFLLSRPSPDLRTSRQLYLINCSRSSLSLTTLPAHTWMTRAKISRTHVVSDSKAPTTFTVDSSGGGIDISPDSGGSDGNSGSNNGGGGGDNGRGGDNGGENDNQGGSHEKKPGMSMSQKLTLGYAALVGIGGLMGFLKGGSKKSLIAGGLSASVLFCVNEMLPTNPVLGSSVGILLSASLLWVMGSRFKKSGKVFPAGVVAFTSLVMSGGYLHGILRSMH